MKKENKCLKHNRVALPFNKVSTNLDYCVCGLKLESTSDKNIEWEEKFDKEIICHCDGENETAIGRHTISDPFKIKQFIRQVAKEAYEKGLNIRKEYNDPSLLKQIEEQIKKALLEKIEKLRREVGKFGNDYIEGFNEAIQDVINLLKEKK